MELSVVVLNLNTKDFLHDCLDSLVSSHLARDRFEIIVADNGSTDGSVEMVQREFPTVKILENGQNLGFAKANNWALPIISPQTNYVLFLNSDTRVPPETLPEMLDLMNQDQKIGAATGYVETREGTIDWNCHRGFPTPLSALSYFTGLHKIFPKSKLFGSYYQTYKDLKSTHEVDAVEGAFMLVRREAGEQVTLSPGKWWDEDFFFFGEDLDFCYRLKEKGWKIIYHPQVKIWHYKGATHGFNKQGVVELTLADRQKLIKSTTEAMKLFYQKHYLKKYPGWLTGLVFFAVSVLGKFRSWKGGI